MDLQDQHRIAKTEESITLRDRLPIPLSANTLLWFAKAEYSGADKKAMFELPRYVIKEGQIVVEQGEIRQELEGVGFGEDFRRAAPMTRPQTAR